MASRRGVYPGSFNPPTLAHIAIAAAARDQHQLDEVTLVVSTVTLAKESVDRPILAHRLAVLRKVTAEYPWLATAVTDHQLLVDISAGFDCLIMGADKWLQIHDPVFYRDEIARDLAIARLPTVAVAPRDGIDIPNLAQLAVGTELQAISSSAARAGATRHMCEPARVFDAQTGAWTDPDRYERHLATIGHS